MHGCTKTLTIANCMQWPTPRPSDPGRAAQFQRLALGSVMVLLTASPPPSMCSSGRMPPAGCGQFSSPSREFQHVRHGQILARSQTRSRLEVEPGSQQDWAHEHIPAETAAAPAYAGLLPHRWAGLSRWGRRRRRSRPWREQRRCGRSSCGVFLMKIRQGKLLNTTQPGFLTSRIMEFLTVTIPFLHSSCLSSLP